MENLEGIRAGLVQFDPGTADIDGNARRILERIEEAKAAGLDLVVFPEMALTAYCIGDRHKDFAFAERCREAMERIAAACDGILAIVGHLSHDPDDLMPDGFFARYNAYSILGEGRVLAGGAKRLLIDDGVLDDSRHYVPGEVFAPHPVRIRDREVSLGVLVCQDLWDDTEDVHPSRMLAEQGADLLVAINSSPFRPGKVRRRVEVSRRRALETGLPVLYVNTVGAQDNGKNIILFDGASFLLGADGTLLHQAQQFAEGMEVVELSDRTAAVVPSYDRIGELHRALATGIRDFFVKTPVFDGVVLGLSGGVDSAVNACLCAEVLGPERVLCVNMPSRFNSEVTKGIAARLAENLGARYLIHPIQDVIDLKVAEHARINGNPPSTLTVENMQARERGNILMQYSQELSLMVVGNGNKTEFQRGYATLYGDIIGALMPLGDVNKLDVYSLARRFNREEEVIPSEVFEIKASAELSEEQSVDEGKGDPFDYHIESPLGVELVENLKGPGRLAREFAARELDEALWAPDAEGRSVYDKVTEEEFREMAAATFRAIRRSCFKRVQAPPILIVSRRAFGFDYRETLFDQS